VEEILIAAFSWYKYGSHSRKTRADDEQILRFIKEELLAHYTIDRVKSVIAELGSISDASIEIEITTHIIEGLIKDGKITTNEVFQLWFENFLAVVETNEDYFNNPGLVDITGWTYCTITTLVQRRIIDDV